MLGEEAEITFCDAQGTKKKYKFTDEEDSHLFYLEFFMLLDAITFMAMLRLE